MAWRLGIVVIGFIWSVLLWKQQAQTAAEQTNAVMIAVNKANEHSDGQTATVRKDLGNVGEAFKDGLKATNRSVNKLSDIVLKGQTSLSQDIQKVKPTPAKQAELQFSLWSDDLSTFPLTNQVVQASPDGSFAIEFFGKNISDISATTGNMWAHICSGCKYTKEPMGFSRLSGENEHERNKRLDNVNPGESLEKMTLNISVPVDVASVQIAFNYSCQTCIHTAASKWQTFTVYPVTKRISQ
jgi:hypothetical protein